MVLSVTVSQTCDAEESDGCPAGEIGEDEESHALGDSEVGAGGRRDAVRAAADGAVHAAVAGAHQPEGGAVEGEQHDQVGEVRSLEVLQGQANATNIPGDHESTDRLTPFQGVDTRSHCWKSTPSTQNYRISLFYFLILTSMSPRMSQ